MRLALGVCALVLAAPAVALAREPVISYVDETGTFRLYDEETESEVNPPPPVPAPANFLGFRYGMSMNGRYIVYNDDPAPRHLHLLDRATNTLVPLPGIDVYANPDNLTVSNTGLIGFDSQGSGPVVVYDSAAKEFLPTGLETHDGHGQSRLSGNGHFLGTTCLSNCIVDSGGDSDPYVQDLSSKSDTAFPDLSSGDEEHPCLDGDGSIFGADRPISPPAIQTRDVVLFDRSQSPPAPIDITGVNTALGNEVRCVLDTSGDYLGFSDQATGAFSLFRVSNKTFVSLPPDKEFNEFSLLSDPYSPPQPPGGGNPPPGAGDAKPVVSRFRMAHRRFRVRRRATSFKFNLSEPGSVRIVIRRLGKKVGEIRRRGLKTGRNTISFSGKLGRRKLRPGQYAAVLIARDQAGNRSLPVLIEFRVLRPRPRRH